MRVGCMADPAVEGYCEPEPHFLPLGGGDYDASFTGARCQVQICAWVPSAPNATLFILILSWSTGVLWCFHTHANA